VKRLGQTALSFALFEPAFLNEHGQGFPEEKHGVNLASACCAGNRLGIDLNDNTQFGPKLSRWCAGVWAGGAVNLRVGAKGNVRAEAE